MPIGVNLVKAYLDAGINVIGISDDKRPAGGLWKRFMTEKQIPRVLEGTGLGLVCGAISGGMEVIDIDLKHDDSGELYDRYVSLIKDNDPELFDSLMIIETPSGGYHWLYRCSVIEGNKKLAKKANKEVLIETRGEGGYIASIPMKGYKAVQGRFSTIPTITPEQRELLLAAAREFNEHIEEVRVPKSTFNQRYRRGQTSWEHFNSENSCHDLLIQKGWTVAKQDNKRIYMLRPGHTNTAYSGNISKELNLWICYSSSTEFDPEKAYSPFGIYAVLWHNGDFSAAASQLYHEGWGDRVEQTETHSEYRAEKQKPTNEDIEQEDDLKSYLSDYDEDDKYLEDAYSGKLEVGKTTGSSNLDKHFLWKDGSFVIVVGHTNIGKTLSLLYLFLLATIVHDWRAIIITMENKSGFAKRRLMEFYQSKLIKNMSRAEFLEAKKFVEDHFTFIKGRGGKINTIPQLLNVAYRLADDQKYDLMMIDPYSGFKKELKKGMNEHSYDYEMAGDFLDFSERTGIRVVLNSHTATESRRKRRDDDGFMSAPYMDDAEGGGKWTNRCDQAIVLHRKTNHPDPAHKYKTLFYLEKDREIEAGGALTNREQPVEMVLLPNMCEFIIGSETNIVHRLKQEKRDEKKGVQSEMIFENVIEDDLPF